MTYRNTTPQYATSDNNLFHSISREDRRPLWSSFGHPVEGCLTWKEAIKEANMDWEVEKRPVFMANPTFDNSKPVSTTNEKGWKVPDNFVVCRKDIIGPQSVLGNVGARYTCRQNNQNGEWVDRILQSKEEAHYVNAGFLGNGERVFAVAKIPFDINFGDDQQQAYLMFYSSHDGSTADTFSIQFVRKCCTNQLELSSRRAKHKIKIRHTKNADARFNEMTAFWNDVEVSVTSLQKNFKKMIDTKVTPEGFRTIASRLFGAKWEESTKITNNLATIAQVFENNDDSQFPEQKGSYYNLLNAVTECTDHSRTSRVRSGSGYTSNQARYSSALIGSGSVLKQDALQYILEEVEEPTQPSVNAHSQVNVDATKPAISRILDQVTVG